MKHDIPVLPVLKFNASSFVFTNIDDIDTFYRLHNTTVIHMKNVGEIINAIDTADIQATTHIFIIFKVESVVDILKLTDILAKPYLSKVMCMRFTLPVEIQNESRLGSVFREFNIKKHETTLQFTPGLVDAIQLSQDTIDKLLQKIIKYHKSMFYFFFTKRMEFLWLLKYIMQ